MERVLLLFISLCCWTARGARIVSSTNAPQVSLMLGVGCMMARLMTLTPELGRMECDVLLIKLTSVATHGL